MTIREKKLVRAVKAMFNPPPQPKHSEVPASLEPSSGAEPPPQWDLEITRRTAAEFLSKGKSGAELVGLLVRRGYCAPIECEILDYKREYGESALDQAELLKDIASFHNTYGGYLIIGVSEAPSDDAFVVTGSPFPALSTEQIRAKLTAYLGTRIMVETQRLEVPKADGAVVFLDVVFIPKRPESQLPVSFQKQGPDTKAKKPLFQAGAFYYRNGDECLEARGPKILELQSSRRENPYLRETSGGLPDFEVRGRLSHNLPDRSVICKRFVGREGLIDGLWKWAADDLSHIKVLAGEGGRGKTSIAYEFAEQLSEHPRAPFDQIVWLTAKKQQFSSSRDDFVEMPETHYSSYDTLLVELGLSCGLTVQDLEGLSVTEQKRLLKGALELVPSFVVIDDIDSLPRDEQKKVLEIGLLIGGAPSKLLLTTRENPSVSDDLAIRVPGFTKEEAIQYVEILRERMGFAALTASQLDSLWMITSGSPLYLESLCRLFRYHHFSDAVQSWKGKDGRAVRAAALEREIEMLSPDARRCLLVMALVSEASLPEIRTISGLSTQKLRECVDELQTLFLVGAPTLGDEPRFRVDQTTALLVIDRKEHLVLDHAKLEARLKELRSQGTGTTGGYDRRVASVISQAEVLLKQRDVPGAFVTVEDGIKKLAGHKDLLGYMVQLLVKHKPEDLHKARSMAIEAHRKGCKRPRFYEAWFEAEWSAEGFPQAENVADLALALGGTDNEREWLVRKAASLASQAELRRSSGDDAGSVNCYVSAAQCLNRAAKLMKPSDAEDWYAKVRLLTDQVWYVARAQAKNVRGCADGIAFLERVWRTGDSRILLLKRMISVLEQLARHARLGFGGPSEDDRQVGADAMSRILRCVKEREAKYPGDPRHPRLLEAIAGCEHDLVALG